MIKLFAYLLVFGGIFWCGYYVGQQPPGEVQHQLETFSEDMVEKAFGVDREEWILRREALEAKARFLKSKAAILDDNYEKATEELDKALLHVKQAIRRDSHDSADSQSVVSQMEEIRRSLISGEGARENLDEAQKKLDRWLED